MSAEKVLATVAALHQPGRIKPDALVIGEEVIALSDIGCPTCLTSWPCPTTRAITQTPGGEVSSGKSSPTVAVEPATPRPPALTTPKETP